MHAAFRFAQVAIVVACSAVTVSAATSDAELFELKVQPILREHCFKCHSHGAEKIKGGLVLDSASALLTGGDTGPAIVPGQPEKSLLIAAIKQTGELKMPAKANKLSDDDIAVIEQWVKAGAPAPATKAVAGAASSTLPNGPMKRTGKITDEDRKWWAYQPLKAVTPPAVKDSKWARNDADRFVLARLEREGLAPATEAPRATLVRRLYFDLWGFPPSPEEVA